MKVTAIVGSPRKKGDCVKVIDMIEKSFNRKENTQIDYVFLSDMGLGFCKSCLLCYTKGEGNCPHKEVTSVLLDKMMNSEVVIFASPVYEHQITALMKNFYDNFSFMFHRPRFFDKKAIIVSSTAVSGLKETLKYMKMNAIGWGFQIAGTVGVCGPSLISDANYAGKVQRNIDDLVDGLLSEKGKLSPSLYQLSMFRAMQVKALRSAAKKNVEYNYWKERGWFDRDYYENEGLGVLKKIYSKLVGNMIRKSMNNKVMYIK